MHPEEVALQLLREGHLMDQEAGLLRLVGRLRFLEAEAVIEVVALRILLQDHHPKSLEVAC